MQYVVKTRLLAVTTKETMEDNIKKMSVLVSLIPGNHAYSMVPVFQIISPDDIQIVDTGDIDRAKMPAAQDYLDKLVENGFAENGRTYVPIYAGSSDQRNGRGVFILKSKLWSTIDWCSCGAIKPNAMSPLTCGKIAKYLALMMSSCKRWREVFADRPYMAYPEIEDFVVLNDVEVPLAELVDETTPTSVKRSLILASDGKTMKITDGLVIYVIDDRGMTIYQRKKVMDEAEAFTIRLAFHKGLAVPVLRSTLEHFFEVHPDLKKKLLRHALKDAWGREVDILNYRIITFKSVFKGWKCFQSHEHFEREFRARNHEVWVCVQAHGHKWASLPYQQLQTLDATEEEVVEFAHHTCDYLLAHAKPGEFGKLMEGSLGKIVDVYPELLNDPYVKEALQTSWISKVKKALEGRILHTSHNLFCSPDILAVLEGIFGLPIKGAIAKGFVITSAFDPGDELGATRCPHLDHAWGIVINMAVPEEWRGLFLGTTIFFSCWDSFMILFQMDFDGDHVNVTKLRKLIEVAKRSKRTYNNVPLMYAAMDDGKKLECKDYIQELKLLFRSLFKAPIGLYANALTKIWAIRGKIDWIKVACLTRKGNTCIDEAGGHGKDASQGIAEEAVNQLKFTPKPSFLAVRNGRISDDGMSIIEDIGNYRFYKQSVVEQYSAVCRLLLPQRIDEVADYTGIGKFDPKILMSDPDIKGLKGALAGLISDKGGLFNELCRSAVAEEAMIDFSSSMAAVPDFRIDKAQEIEIAVAEFAMDRDMTLDRAVDLLAIHLFGWVKRTDHFVSYLKRWFFLAFGDRVLANVVKNLSKETEPSGDYDVSDEDEEA